MNRRRHLRTVLGLALLAPHAGFLGATEPSPDLKAVPVPTPAGQTTPAEPSPQIHRIPLEAGNSPLTAAHRAYAGGRPDEARQLYLQVLQQDPDSSEALVGLAMLELMAGSPAAAARHFATTLALDPKNPVAIAGLANLHASNPVASESRLRQALGEQPDSPALHFALGNALARQQRWAAARRAYERAHELAPDDGDAQFNLAVSLDQLGQTIPAMAAYRQALATASHRPAAFDRRQARQRLDELETWSGAPR